MYPWFVAVIGVFGYRQPAFQTLLYFWSLYVIIKKQIKKYMVNPSYRRYGGDYEPDKGY